MDIIIYITLILLSAISGLLAASPYEPDKKPKEETVIDKLGLSNPVETKKHIQSRLISLTVFALSLASLMAMYFIKG